MFANLMIESGIVCSVIAKTLANEFLKSTPSARWITTKRVSDLETFTKEPIEVLVKAATRVV